MTYLLKDSPISSKETKDKVRTWLFKANGYILE